jgi:ribosome maturation factor RimP
MSLEKTPDVAPAFWYTQIYGRTSEVGESPLFYCGAGYRSREMKKNEAISRIEQIAASVAVAGGLELVEVELKGAGANQLLRIVIDKPGGVSHADCEFVSREAGTQLDGVFDDSGNGNALPGPYQLEVSSPGVERKLKKWQDWERFRGQKVKVVLKQPAEGNLRHFDGIISQTAADANGAHIVTVELADGKHVTVPVDQVDRANLKFEW